MSSQKETGQQVWSEDTSYGCTFAVTKWTKGKRVVNYGWELNIDFFCAGNLPRLIPDVGAAETMRLICIRLGASKKDIQEAVDLGHWHQGTHWHCYFANESNCYKAAVAIEAAFKTMKLAGVGFYDSYGDNDIFHQAYENAIQAQESAYDFEDYPDEVPL